MELNLEQELKQHIIDTIKDQYSEYDTDFSALHYHAFKEDYYIIGYYQAEQWLKAHGIGVFEVIEEVKEYEMQNFGEFNTVINAEAIVNMYTYIKGKEVLNALDVDLDNVIYDDLLEVLQND